MIKFLFLPTLILLLLASCKNDVSEYQYTIGYRIVLEEDYSHKGIYAFDQRVYLKHVLYYFTYETEQWSAVSDGNGLEANNRLSWREFEMLSFNDNSLVFSNRGTTSNYIYRNKMFESVSGDISSGDNSYFGYTYTPRIKNSTNSHVYYYEIADNFDGPDSCIVKRLNINNWKYETFLKISYNDSIFVYDILPLKDSVQFVLKYYNHSYYSLEDSIYFLAFYDKENERFNVSKTIKKTNNNKLFFIEIKDEPFLIENNSPDYLSSYRYLSTNPDDFPVWFNIKNLSSGKTFHQLDILLHHGPENPESWAEISYKLLFNWKLTKHNDNYYLFVNDMVYKYITANDTWEQLQSIPFKTLNPKP